MCQCTFQNMALQLAAIKLQNPKVIDHYIIVVSLGMPYIHPNRLAKLKQTQSEV